jgi:hypothetical protein
MALAEKELRAGGVERVVAGQGERPCASSRRRLQPAFIRDVNISYLLGLIACAAATLDAFVSALATVVMTVVLALVFLLSPSPRSALR